MLFGALVTKKPRTTDPDRKSPFRRVKAEEIPVDQKFADNSFEAKVSLVALPVVASVKQLYPSTRTCKWKLQ